MYSLTASLQYFSAYGGGGFDVSGFGNGDTPQADKKVSYSTNNSLGLSNNYVRT